MTSGALWYGNHRAPLVLRAETGGVFLEKEESLYG
nr:MAG TPA: hypothetical protein [Caudoviricetes sp.]